MQQVQYISVDKLTTHPQNPRKIDERQFDILCDSIRKNPDYFEARPVLCNPQMVIFAGNMRFLAAKKIGMDAVPVVIMDISEERQKEIMIRDNRQNGDWDFDLLANTFDSKNLLDWGLSEIELGLSSRGSSLDSSTDTDISGSLDTEHECPSCGYKW